MLSGSNSDTQNFSCFLIFRHHKKAIRQVTYHPRYPLFASCGDDGTVIICHGMVYRFESEINFVN